MKYRVTFFRSYTTEVTAASEDLAYNQALEDFYDFCRRPVANTEYDDVAINAIDDSDDNE